MTTISPLCAYVDVCQVNAKTTIKGRVLRCEGTFKRCKELGMQEQFGGFPDIAQPARSEMVSYSSSAITKTSSSSSTSAKAFPDYKEENTLTLKGLNGIMGKLGDLKLTPNNYYVLTPDEIYLLRNPPLEWEEKEMVMGVDLGVEEGTGIVTIKNTSSIEESQESMSMTAEARSRYEELDALDKKLKEAGITGSKAGVLLKQLLMRQGKTKEEKPKKEDRALLI
jgi:hypothetical protein